MVAQYKTKMKLIIFRTMLCAMLSSGQFPLAAIAVKPNPKEVTFKEVSCIGILRKG
jgi:hypothetical protein